jgi:ATP-binding cassette subfamily B protein
MFSILWQQIKLAYKASKMYVVVIFTSSIVEALLSLLSTFVFSLIIDTGIKYLTIGDSSLITLLWIYFGILVGRWTFANFNNQIAGYFGEVHKAKVLDYLDNQITAKIDKLPTDVIEDSKFHDQMTNIQIFSKQKFTENLSLFGRLVQEFAFFINAFIIVIFNNFILAIIVLLVSIPEVRYNIRMTKKFREVNEELTITRRKKSYYTELTQNIEVFFNLKSYNLYNYFIDKIHTAQKEILTRFSKVRVYHQIRATIVGTIANWIGRFLPLGWYMNELILKKITVGQFQFYVMLINQLYDSSFRFYAAYLNMNENNLYVKDLLDFLDREEFTKTKDVQNIDLDNISLEFKNIWFKYPHSEKFVLKGINFKINNNEKLAIVGHNGAGKSTILKLINKFYEPTKGEILVNGINLQNIDTDLWRKKISFLSQDVPHFYMNLEDNIVIGDQDYKLDKDKLNETIKRASLEKDVAELPEQEKTMLGKYFPKGINLSGGQWQKVSIARSFYRNAKLLILDEPTSAIDSSTEQKIFDEIFENSKGQTQLIISHKFSNIKKADSIIVVESGEIIEQGSHAELMKIEGEYARLYNVQVKAFVE